MLLELIMFIMQTGCLATYEWLNPSKIYSEYTNFINKVFLNKGEEKKFKDKMYSSHVTSKVFRLVFKAIQRNITYNRIICLFM